MTYAAARLLELRDYLKRVTGLSNVALGIVGDENHVGGYHHGWANRRIVNGQTADYSWNESTRDGSHRTNAAAAIDIGSFHRLRELSNWLVGQCEAGASDTNDIRSIIYTPDGRVVRRWDRLRRRSTGDSSHLTHTHISFFRAAEGRDKVAPFRRFFEGDPMADIGVDIDYMAWRIEALSHGFDSMRAGPEQGVANWAVQTLKRIEALGGKPASVTLTPEDRAAIVAEVVAELKPALDLLAVGLRRDDVDPGPAEGYPIEGSPTDRDDSDASRVE